jgi:phosphoserine phosphatase RsbU/P
VFSPLIQKKDRTAFIYNHEKWMDIFLLVVREAIRSVGAKYGTIYLLDSQNQLQSVVESDINRKVSDSLARDSFLNRKDFYLKKGEIWEGATLKESFIVVFLGEDTGHLDLGVLVLEGIYHFDSFSLTDFELIQVYSKTLSLLIKEGHVYENDEEIYLKFSTSFLLLLHSTDNYQKNTRLEYLLKEVIRVSGLINSSRHLDVLLRDVMESVKSVFRTESCSILLVDKLKNELYFHLVAGEKEEEITKIRVPMGKGIAGTVALTREPMIINDAQNDDRVYKVVDKTTGFITRNILAAPLVAGDEVVGVVEAINTIDRNNFDESDINLFLSFSDAAALAIQKTRLLEDLEKSNKDLEKTVSELGSLFELGLAINESQKVSELLQKSIAIISRELSSDRVAIIVLNKTGNYSVNSYINRNFEFYDISLPENSILYQSIKNNKVYHEEFFQSEHYAYEDTKFLNSSFILMPLIFRNEEPFGVLVVSDKKGGTAYAQSQFRLLLTISSQIVKGYENLKLRDDMLAKKAMEKEIEITRNLQNNILPAKKPSGSNFDLGVKTVPAKEVSGDFYDYYKYDDGQFSFLIADVSGKSLPAAIFMAMSSSIIRTISRNHELSPDEMLQAANALIYEDSQSGMFVTLFYIHYNPSTSMIDFASAGHNDQIWIKGDGSYEFLKGKGAPLGVIPTSQYVGGSIKISSGDMIVLYTDGAIEEKDSSDEEYGLDRFVEEIVKRRNLPSQQIIEEIYKEIRIFSNFEEQFDDFTVLILKFNDDYQFRKTFLAQNSQIPKLRDFINETIEVRKLSARDKEDILLCCDEAATNIIMHSYKETNIKNPNFECSIRFTEDAIQISLRDKGKKFEREKVPAPSIEANMKGERKGGFGVFLVEKLMDSVEYLQDGDYNEVILKKKIISDSDIL